MPSSTHLWAIAAAAATYTCSNDILITSSAFNKSSIVNSNNFGIHSTSTWETCICTLYGIIIIIYFPCSCSNWCDVLFNFLFLFCFCLQFIFTFQFSLLCRRNKMNSFIEIVPLLDSHSLWAVCCCCCYYWWRSLQFSFCTSFCFLFQLNEAIHHKNSDYNSYHFWSL